MPHKMHAYLIMKTSFSNKLSVSHRRTIDSSQSESPYRLNTCSMFSATTSQLSQDPYHIRVFFQDSTDMQIYIYISYAPDLLTHTPHIYMHLIYLHTHTHIYMSESTEVTTFHREHVRTQSQPIYKKK